MNCDFSCYSVPGLQNKKRIIGTCSERKEIERLLPLITFIRLGYDNKGMSGKDEEEKPIISITGRQEGLMAGSITLLSSECLFKECIYFDLSYLCI